jgi:hypothetical protein
LNFPNRRPIPATPEETRARARQAHKAAKSSRYLGVSFIPHGAQHPWTAFLKRYQLGRWPSEKAAALAHDRAALFYGRELASLNFPGRRGAIPPADAATLQWEAHQLYKTTTTSRFRGVYWLKSSQKWRAFITIDQRLHHLGLFEDEEAAARAVDRRALADLGGDAKLNFDPVSGEPIYGRRVEAKSRARRRA